MPTPIERLSTEVAGYKIESLLGRGGMGEVYLARQDFPDRRVALKLLARELADDAGFRERFVRESNAAASLEHPNILPVYEAGESDGELYLAMRYVEGTDLRRLIEDEGPLEPRRAVSIISQIADALDEAHEHHLVHRDVKPGNILVSKGDRAYLSDFGLIRRSETRTGVTKTGQFMGSVDFVAPEQIEGAAVDGRADIYSLGCVLYECLTGAAPFVRESEVATLYAHLQDPPPQVTRLRPELPTELDRVIAKAMAKTPAERYPTASGFAEAALRAIGPEAVAAPRSRRALVGALVAGLVVLAAIVVGSVLSSRGGNGAAPEPRAEPTLAPNQVVTLDPLTEEVGEGVSIPAPDEGTGIAVGEGGVWAITNHGIAHIDPETLEVNEIAGLADARDVVVGGRAVWATGGSYLYRLDPATDEVRSLASLMDHMWISERLAVGGQSLWVAQGYGHVARVDMATTEFITNIDTGGADDVAFGAGSLWVLNDLSGEVLRIDTTSNEIADRIELAGRLTKIAADDRDVWVLDGESGTVTRIDAADRSLVDRYRVGSDPTDIQVGFGAVWVANRGDGTVSRIDPDLGTVETIEVGGPVASIAVDGETGVLWLQLAQTP